MIRDCFAGPYKRCSLPPRCRERISVCVLKRGDKIALGGGTNIRIGSKMRTDPPAPFCLTLEYGADTSAAAASSALPPCFGAAIDTRTGSSDDTLDYSSTQRVSTSKTRDRDPSVPHYSQAARARQDGRSPSPMTLGLHTDSTVNALRIGAVILVLVVGLVAHWLETSGHLLWVFSPASS